MCFITLVKVYATTYTWGVEHLVLS